VGKKEGRYEKRKGTEGEEKGIWGIELARVRYNKKTAGEKRLRRKGILGGESPTGLGNIIVLGPGNDHCIKLKWGGEYVKAHVGEKT